MWQQGNQAVVIGGCPDRRQPTRDRLCTPVREPFKVGRADFPCTLHHKRIDPPFPGLFTMLKVEERIAWMKKVSQQSERRLTTVWHCGKMRL